MERVWWLLTPRSRHLIRYRGLIKLSWIFIGPVPIPGPKHTCPGPVSYWSYDIMRPPHKAPPLFWNEGTSISRAPLPAGWFVSTIIPWNRSGKWLQCENGGNWWWEEGAWRSLGRIGNTVRCLCMWPGRARARLPQSVMFLRGNQVCYRNSV